MTIYCDVYVHGLIGWIGGVVVRGESRFDKMQSIKTSRSLRRRRKTYRSIKRRKSARWAVKTTLQMTAMLYLNT
eukprot:scaffold55593_cov38-Cyclotella_meneghiniana.AAC.3